MSKRTNPFGESTPLQLKTHIREKEVSHGVNSNILMESVYERTRSLLYEGARKQESGHVTIPRSESVDSDMTDDGSAASTQLHVLPGQLHIDTAGQLTAQYDPTSSNTAHPTSQSVAATLNGTASNCKLRQPHIDDMFRKSPLV